MLLLGLSEGVSLAGVVADSVGAGSGSGAFGIDEGRSTEGGFGASKDGRSAKAIAKPTAAAASAMPKTTFLTCGLISASWLTRVLAQSRPGRGAAERSSWDSRDASPDHRLSSYRKA